MIGTELNLSHTTIHQILTNGLRMRKVFSKLVLRNLTQDQKDMRRDRCVDFLELIKIIPIFWNISLPVTRLGCLSTTRTQSARAWNGTLKVLQGQKKAFFDSQEIVHKEFVPPYQEVNQHFYRDVLERLRKRVMRMRPNIKNNWVLHLDNALCYRAISTNSFLASKNIPMVPQPIIHLT